MTNSIPHRCTYQKGHKLIQQLHNTEYDTLHLFNVVVHIIILHNVLFISVSPRAMLNVQIAGRTTNGCERYVKGAGRGGGSYGGSCHNTEDRIPTLYSSRLVTAVVRVHDLLLPVVCG